MVYVGKVMMVCDDVLWAFSLPTTPALSFVYAGRLLVQVTTAFCCSKALRYGIVLRLVEYPLR